MSREPKLSLQNNFLLTVDNDDILGMQLITGNINPLSITFYKHPVYLPTAKQNNVLSREYSFQSRDQSFTDQSTTTS